MIEAGKRFEYMSTRMPTYPTNNSICSAEAVNHLNNAGQEGWELVSIIHSERLMIYKREIIAGRSKGIEENADLKKEWFDAGLAANKIMLDDFTEQINNITKCLPKDFHPDISLPARVMNLWQYYEANENKLKSLQEALELTLAKDDELCEINEGFKNQIQQGIEREKDLEEKYLNMETYATNYQAKKIEELQDALKEMLRWTDGNCAEEPLCKSLTEAEKKAKQLLNK